MRDTIRGICRASRFDLYVENFACTEAFEPYEPNLAFCGNRARKERGLLSMHSNNMFRTRAKRRVRETTPTDYGRRNRVARRPVERRERKWERVRENQAPASLPLLLWPIIHWVTVRPSADQPWAAAPLMCIVYTGCRESTDMSRRDTAKIALIPHVCRV